MNHLRLLRGVACLSVLLLPRVAAAEPAAPPAPPPTPSAVVELFTSQGCSSTPPADAVLRGLAADARRGGGAVYTLSFHVTYWDDLGWVDPHGAPFADAHQEAYRRSFKNRSKYTPQTVVNGSWEGVGSRGREVSAAVGEALAAPAALGVAAAAGADAGGVAVSWSLSGPAAGGTLLLALTQASSGNPVPCGENRGRELHHVDVVRAFERVRLGADASGHARLPLPAALRGADLAVTAYVQDPRTGHVRGATRVPVR